MAQELNGKIAVVTGACRGIGRASAKELALAGAQVVLNWNESEEDINNVVTEIRSLGGKCMPVRADVSNEIDVKEMFAYIDEVWGAIDIVVNNAGVALSKAFTESTEEDFHYIFDTNVRGAFFVGKEALLRMQGRTDLPRLINIGSELGYIGRPNNALYAASKAAVMNLTKSWATEFAPYVLVNTIAPGPISTRMLDPKSMSEESLELELNNPVGRLGTVDEVAGCVRFLCSPAATFITGQAIGPNGGAVMM